MTANASHTLSKLDIEKFRKVRALVEGGQTEGERSAALSRATDMAAKAGLTLAEAASLAADSDKQSAESSFFSDLFNSPPFREAAAAGEAKKARMREEVIAKMGSEEAVFLETEREHLLSEAVEHLKERRESGGIWLEGELGFTNIAQLSPSLKTAVSSAYPLPANVVEALREYEEWDALYVARDAFGSGGHWPWVDARVAVVEHILDTLAVQSWEDLDARMTWWQIEIDRESAHSGERMQTLHDRIAADHAILREMSKLGVQTGQPTEERRTNAKKAADVAEMIRQNPDLSSREIARKLGISPQTVATWRKKLAGGAG